MVQVIINSAVFGLLLSIICYLIGLYLKNKFKSPVLNPVLISMALVIIVLLILKIDYEVYIKSASFLTFLLTPATICLAIPLYKQLELLKSNFKVIILGVLVGTIASLASILVLCVLFNLTHEQYVTLLPKSITTAIGMGVSDELGGTVNITVAVIVLTGVLGNIIAETTCKIFKITNPIAKGLAIGTSSHAIGTSKALEIGEIEGAMSSLAIVVAGLITTVGASIFTMLY